MKTSNKLLLGIFLTGLLFITAVHVMIYAKYKNGAYTIMKFDSGENLTVHQLKAARYVRIMAVANMSVVPSDSMKLEVEKDGNISVRYEYRGDTLVIRGDSVYNRNGRRTVEYASQQVNLYLPSPVSVTNEFGNLDFVISEQMQQGGLYEISLKYCKMQFTNQLKGFYSDKSIDSLSVRAISSEIGIDKNITVNKLNLQLSDASSFTDNGGFVGEMMLSMDNTSTILLHGNNAHNVKSIKK